MEYSPSNPARVLLRGIFFVAVNVILIVPFNFLTIDSWANGNSRVGALLLGFFLPFFIVYRTPRMPSIERLLKFGLGLIVDMVLIVIIAGLREGVVSGLVPSLILALVVLYFGDRYAGQDA